MLIGNLLIASNNKVASKTSDKSLYFRILVKAFKFEDISLVISSNLLVIFLSNSEARLFPAFANSKISSTIS